jgi:hypothetical protein
MKMRSHKIRMNSNIEWHMNPNVVLTTLRKELREALVERDEGFDDIVAMTLTDAELDKEFSKKVSNGLPFTAWTQNRVYFSTIFDGDLWVASVPRHPCKEKAQHICLGSDS